MGTLDSTPASIAWPARSMQCLRRHIWLRDELKASLLWLAQEPGHRKCRSCCRYGPESGAQPDVATEPGRIDLPEDSNANVACDAVGRHALAPLKRPGIVNRISLNIDSHDDRQLMHLEFIDGFHAQVFKGNDPRRLDRF